MFNLGAAGNTRGGGHEMRESGQRWLREASREAGEHRDLLLVARATVLGQPPEPFQSQVIWACNGGVKSCVQPIREMLEGLRPRGMV